MLGRQELLAIALLLSVAGMVIASHLVLEQIGKRPFVTDYSEHSENGDLVRMSGKIERAILTKNGGHCILTVNNLSVFIPNRIAADTTFTLGTNITVTGIVQTYGGEREIAVQSASDIVIPERK